MEPAVPGQALRRGIRDFDSGGRLGAALLFVSALGLLAAGGCRGGGAPALGARWRVGLGACGMGLDASGTRLAVVCRRSNDVWVLSLPDGSLVARVDTLPKPRALLFTPDGGAFYVSEGLSSVALVGLEDRRVEREFRPYWPVDGFAFEPGSRRLFCAQVGLPTLGVYRSRDMHLEDSLAVGGEVEAVAFDGSDAWVVTRRADALVRVSLKSMSVQAGALAGPEPRGLALDPTAGLAYVPCRGHFGAGTPEALALPSPIPGAEVQPGSDDAENGAAAAPESAEGVSGPAGEAEDLDDLDQSLGPAAAGAQDYDGSGVAVLRLRDVRRVDYLDVPGGPMAAVLSPSGRLLALACEDGALRLVDLKARKVTATLDLGGRPGAMLAAPDGRTLLVALRSDKAVERILPGGDWR